MKLKRKPDKRDIISIIGIGLFTSLTVFLAIRFYREVGGVNGGAVDMAERFRDLIVGYGNKGFVVLVGVHILHIIVPVIPASAAQFAGSLVYGIPLSLLAGTIGISIGTVIAFYISRLMGRDVVTLFISSKKLENAEDILSKDVSALVLFLMFLLPMPKDFLPYFIGLTRYPIIRLLLISLIGRFPGMLVTCYAGRSVFGANYAPLIIGLSLCVLFTALSFVLRTRIMAYIGKKKKRK